MSTVPRTLDDSPPLTPTEVADLAAHEKVIEAGRDTFVQVGLALLAVREGKLYRATHYTFAAYCADKWGISDRHSRRLMAAAKVTELTGPTGPVSEAVARELAPLRDDPAALAGVWEEAQLLARGGTPTASHAKIARENRVLRTVATRRPHVLAEVVNGDPATAEIMAATAAVRRAVEATDRYNEEGIRQIAREQRNRPDSRLVIQIRLMIVAEELRKHVDEAVKLMRNGALDKEPPEVRAEIVDNYRKLGEQLLLATRLAQDPVVVTDEALGKWLDQSGDQQ